jgi:hypothetical protein
MKAQGLGATDIAKALGIGRASAAAHAALGIPGRPAPAPPVQ